MASKDKKCKFCLIIRQKICGQLMGFLPPDRTIPSKAFEVVCSDIFGPLTMKDSVVKRGARVHKKVYGIMFACFTTRAVYLDLLDNYSIESVLHCVRRLMADKGSVRRIVSDPGTNLKGAAAELRGLKRVGVRQSCRVLGPSMASNGTSSWQPRSTRMEVPRSSSSSVKEL